MILWSLLPIVVAIHTAVDVTASKAQRSTSDGTSATILTPDVVGIVQNIVDADKIPGLTVAIVNKTGHVEFGAWGIKSENGTNMTTDTLFNIGSCSKAFVSASLGILIDDFARGRNSTPLPVGLSNLTWKTKVADTLPDAWKLMDPWASEKANLIDILTHVSGLDRCASYSMALCIYSVHLGVLAVRHDLSYKANFSMGDVTRNLRNLPPSFELREQWSYNNQMYMVGANIVSTLSGKRYADFVEERIFKPLGMSSSTYSIDAAIGTGRFTDTWTSFGRLIPPWLKEGYVDLMAGPGGVISSVEELATWVKMILNGGVDPDTNETIIPPAQFDIITSPHSIISPNISGPVSTLLYGLGWIRYSLEGYDILQHDGGVPGVSTLITVALSNGLGIVALANADDKGDALTNITLAIGEKALSIASSSPAANQSIASRTQHKRRADVTTRADNITGPPALDLAGTYFNAGYGTAVLCSMRSSTPSCQNVLRDFESIDKSLSPNSPDLFVSWNSPVLSHFRFTHTNGTQYVMSVGTIYPGGYGKNSTPFSTLAPVASATFVVESEKVVGFSISIGALVGPVEETSDIWFVKQE
ncbi:beta-lactamase/transpeptidase-like protein [Russula brevipes]|nr:beta-lactamase/transpeptidase-like protein [Russula brevipes]